MAKQTIGIGTSANDGTGDALRTAFTKVNENFTEVYDGKQANLVSGTNIKTVNSTTLLGSGDLAVQPTLVSGTNIKTVNSTSILGSGNIAVQASLVSGTNIKTVNSTTLLGSGDLAVQSTLVSGTNIKTINSNSILGSGNLSITGNPTAVGIQAGNATTVNTAGVNISKAFTITGNTLAATSVLDITTRLSRISGSTTLADVRIYFNTSNSLTGATLMARSNPMQTTDQSVTMQRTFTISGGNIIHTFGNNPRDSDVGIDSTAYSSSAYNVANTYYLLICSSQSGTDPFTCSMAKIAQYA